MDGLIAAALVVGGALTGLWFGYAPGLYSERGAWKLRAERGSSAHYCDGRFYVVMFESDFLRRYRRVPGVHFREIPDTDREGPDDAPV